MSDNLIGERLRSVIIGEIERYLLLRDRLREDREDRELYAWTKRDLASRDWPSMQHYAEAKTEVIEGIIARARRSSRVD